MPDIITQDAPDPPGEFTYQVPGHTSLILLAAGCNFDGTGLAAPFVPTLQIEAPNGWQMFLFGQDVKCATGDIAYVTFAPHLRPPPTPFTTAQYFTQTGMPQLELDAGTFISTYCRALNGGAASPGTTVDSLVLYVEQTQGPSDALGYGPFMLVPGPHSGL